MTTDLEEKPSLSISKQLTPGGTKPQAKVTILGTDRTTFTSALTMALRRYVSEIVIFDPSFNRQMKMCFDDLACALQLCPLSRSVNLVYTSDIVHTSRSDVILITEMHNSNIRMEQHDQRTSVSLKQKAEQLIDHLRGNPSIIQCLLITSPNAVFLIVRSCVSPYDYNSLVVKSLAGNRCHAGQVCGLGSNIYNQRLRYTISELFDIPSKHITGFTLENATKLIEPYWPSITINGQRINLKENENIKQSSSNNAPQDNHQTIKRNITKNDKTVRTYKYLTNTLPKANLKKIPSDYSKKNTSLSHINEKTSVRTQQWLSSNKNKRGIMKRAKFFRKRELGISNNAVNINESQLSLSQSLQDQIIKHLNGWHCLQLLYHRPYNYTLGMNLSQITRSIMSNSEEILILSTYIQPFLKQRSTNHVKFEHDHLFASVPVHIRRYGIHAILNFQSQVELYNHVQKTLKQNRIFRDRMNYPLQKTPFIYEKKRM